MVGGVERLILDIITHLDRNHWDPMVVTVMGSGPLLSEFQRQGIPVEFAGPKLYRANSTLYRLYWLLSVPATLGRLIRILRRKRPVTVTTSLYHADILGMLAARYLRVSHRVVIQHDVERLPGLVAWAKRRLAIPLATKIIANSPTTATFLREYFLVPTNKLAVIPNGIDMAKFQQVGQVAPQCKDLTVGFLGRLEEIKGPQYFMEAIRSLKEQYQLNPPVVVLGDGSLRSQLTEYAECWQLTNVKFVGQVLDPAASLPTMDILVVPSQREGFGSIILEGLASGRVVVASNLPVVSDLIVDGQNGILFSTGNALALAQQLARLLQDRAMVDQLRAGAKQWLVDTGWRYDIGEVTANYQHELAGN